MHQIKWLEHVRTDLPTGGLFTDRYYLTMGAVDLYDCKVVVYELLPLMTAITMAGVFMVVGVAFKSVVVPLRAVLTIAVTLAYIYGAAILVYQHGALDWLGFAPLASTGAVYWMNPCMVFSILVGLGLDYDIFLLSRVVEYREAGYTEEVAILYGLAKTGRIITAAGCIMALAFGGLLLSSEVAMNELAFYLGKPFRTYAAA